MWCNKTTDKEIKSISNIYHRDGLHIEQALLHDNQMSPLSTYHLRYLHSITILLNIFVSYIARNYLLQVTTVCYIVPAGSDHIWTPTEKSPSVSEQVKGQRSHGKVNKRCLGTSRNDVVCLHGLMYKLSSKHSVFWCILACTFVNNQIIGLFLFDVSLEMECTAIVIDLLNDFPGKL